MSADSSVDPVVALSEKPLPFRHKTWSEAEGQREIEAPLKVLPVGLSFSDDFPEPIRYDSVRKLLLYRGFMCYGSFHYLRQLHSDSGYARALDQLFTSSNGQLTSRTRSWRWIALLAGIGIVAAAMAWALLI